MIADGGTPWVLPWEWKQKWAWHVWGTVGSSQCSYKAGGDGGWGQGSHSVWKPNMTLEHRLLWPWKDLSTRLVSWNWFPLNFHTSFHLLSKCSPVALWICMGWGKIHASATLTTQHVHTCAHMSHLCEPVSHREETGNQYHTPTVCQHFLKLKYSWFTMLC